MMTEGRPRIICGCQVVIVKGQEGIFWGNTNVLYHDRDGGHKGIHVCQNSSD